MYNTRAAAYRRVSAATWRRYWQLILRFKEVSAKIGRTRRGLNWSRDSRNRIAPRQRQHPRATTYSVAWSVQGTRSLPRRARWFSARRRNRCRRGADSAADIHMRDSFRFSQINIFLSRRRRGHTRVKQDFPDPPFVRKTLARLALHYRGFISHARLLSTHNNPIWNTILIHDFTHFRIQD